MSTGSWSRSSSGGRFTPESSHYRSVARSAGGAAFLACVVVGISGCARGPVDLPDGRERVRYEQAVPDAARARAWVLASGTLPPGLMLEATGRLEGIPERAGSYSFSVAPQPNASAREQQSLRLRILPAVVGATEPGPTTTPAISWRGTYDYRMFQHVPSGDQISTAHVTIALTEAPPGALTGTADGTVDATLTLSTCPSHTVTPARFHTGLTGTRTRERIELQLVDPTYTGIEITPCPRGGLPGVIGGGKIYLVETALRTLTSVDGQDYRFHSETTYSPGPYPFTVTHTVQVRR